MAILEVFPVYFTMNAYRIERTHQYIFASPLACCVWQYIFWNENKTKKQGIEKTVGTLLLACILLDTHNLNKDKVPCLKGVCPDMWLSCVLVHTSFLIYRLAALIGFVPMWSGAIYAHWWGNGRQSCEADRSNRAWDVFADWSFFIHELRIFQQHVFRFQYTGKEPKSLYDELLRRRAVCMWQHANFFCVDVHNVARFSHAESTKLYLTFWPPKLFEMAGHCGSDAGGAVAERRQVWQSRKPLLLYQLYSRVHSRFSWTCMCKSAKHWCSEVTFLPFLSYSCNFRISAETMGSEHPEWIAQLRRHVESNQLSFAGIARRCIHARYTLISVYFIGLHRHNVCVHGEWGLSKTIDRGRKWSHSENSWLHWQYRLGLIFLLD